jgi:hypothetical protein
LERIARLLLRVAGQVRLMQAFTPRRLTARPAESEQLERKSTTPHYLVYSKKDFENSLVKKKREQHRLILGICFSFVFNCGKNSIVIIFKQFVFPGYMG